jgi:hypothetical protein
MVSFSIGTARSPAADFSVIAPGQVRCILRGDKSPSGKGQQPTVPSVAPVAEFKEKKGANKTGEAYTGNPTGPRIRCGAGSGVSVNPEAGTASRENDADVEGFNVHRRQHKTILTWLGWKGPSESQGRGMQEEMHQGTREALVVPLRHTAPKAHKGKPGNGTKRAVYSMVGKAEKYGSRERLPHSMGESYQA